MGILGESRNQKVIFMPRSLLPTLIGLTLLFTACGGDFRPQAVGENHEIIVVMDSTLHDSEMAWALRTTFGQTIETLPGRNESLYTLRFRDFRTNEELEELKKFRNIIFAGPIDDQTNTSAFIRAVLSDDVEERVRSGESFAFPLSDQWYRDQWILILTSTDVSRLADRIRRSEGQLIEHAMDTEMRRWEESVFRRGEQRRVSENLYRRYGWSIRLQHDYVMTVDTLQVVEFRRLLPDNTRWILGWWKDGVASADMITPEWINATRDSLLEIHMRGSRRDSWVTTEYRRPVETRPVERDDHLLGWETLGTWQMTNDLMGGPFVNFTWYDPAAERLFIIEYGQFAPRYEKRRFVQQFRAMGRSFRSNPDFTIRDYPDDYQILSSD